MGKLANDRKLDSNELPFADAQLESHRIQIRAPFPTELYSRITRSIDVTQYQGRMRKANENIYLQDQSVDRSHGYDICRIPQVVRLLALST